MPGQVCTSTGPHARASFQIHAYTHSQPTHGTAHLHDVLEDGLPVQVDLALVELDVDATQPVLRMRIMYVCSDSTTMSMWRYLW